jgi:hypothetical protein
MKKIKGYEKLIFNFIAREMTLKVDGNEKWEGWGRAQ